MRARPPSRRDVLIALAATAGGASVLLHRAGPAVSARVQGPRTAGRLGAAGRRLIAASAAPFDWCGLTAFRLAEMLARGRRGEVEATLEFCARHEVTVVRVLARARHLFTLSSAEGLRALPELCRLAATRGIQVQVVALADTAGLTRAALVAQLRDVGALCDAHDNAILECANEPYHGTQSRWVMPVVAEFAGPARAMWAQGAARRDGSAELARGTWVAAHLARRGERWAREARVAVLGELSCRTGKFVVSNEPIGAASRAEPARRDDEPEAFRAQALLARLAGVGATFHYEGGLRGRLPEGRELACFLAWREGFQAVPVGLEGPLVPVGAPDSPVARVESGTPAGAWSATNGDRGWTVVLGRTDAVRLAWRDRWRAVRRSEHGPVEVIEIGR